MAYQADLITKQQAVKELKQHSDESGVFSNITDEDVENTPPTFASEAGMGELDVPQDEEDNEASAEKEDPQHESRESNPKDKSKKESKKKTKE
jgi:hypothetical protein